MKIFKTTTLAVTLGLVATFQATQASLISTDPVTLSSLISSQGTISIGDKVFSGFGFTVSGDSSVFNSLTSQANGLYVSAFIGDDGVYYLDWSGVVGVNNIGGDGSLLGDLKLNYTVTANAGSIVMIDQNYTPNVTPQPPGEGSAISIGETVKIDGGQVVGNSLLTLTDLSDPSAEQGDNLYFDPQQKLIVTKDILMIAGTNSFVGLSEVQQSFHQTAVPEPSTVVAGALLLLPFGISTLRILRKKNVA